MCYFKPFQVVIEEFSDINRRNGADFEKQINAQRVGHRESILFDYVHIHE